MTPTQAQKQYQLLSERTLFLSDIDSYRDGGTRSLTYNLGDEKVQVCIDFRLGSRSGEVWLGYPEKEGSIKIQHQHILDKIKESIELRIKNIEFCLEGKFTL